MLRRLTLGSFLMVILFAGAGAVLWHQGWIQDRWQTFFQKRIIENEIRKIEKDLPFKIESFGFEAPWKEFIQGQVRKLTLVLDAGSLRIHLQGPLELRGFKAQEGITARYAPQAWLESKARPRERSSVITPEIQVRASADLKELRELTFRLAPQDFEWKHSGIQAKQLSLGLHWQKGPLQVLLSAESVSITRNPRQLLSLARPDVQLEAQVELAPLRVGPLTKLSFKAISGELLSDDLYLDLPLSQLPLTATLKHNGTPGLFPQSGELRVGDAESPSVQLEWQDRAIQWKTRALELARWAKLAGEIPGLKFMKEWQISSGSFRSSGKARWGSDLILESFEASGKAISFAWKNQALRIKDLSFEVPFRRSPSRDETASGSLAMTRWEALRASGSLPRTPLEFHFRPDGTVQFKTKGPLAFRSDQVPLEFGPLEGSWDGTPLKLQTALKIQKVQLSRLAEVFCAAGPGIPPAELSMNFPQVSASHETIEPQGSVKLSLFNGAVSLSGIGMYGLFSEVPEVDFDAEWNGIRLDELGQWLNFGEMDGLLTGYARDVTFQSWLPTHYDFRLEAKPHRHSDIVFSPEAMKNVVKIFAGDDLDTLPGFANWLAFGWPSRIFGGYDVEYVGLTILSQDGSILINTLDPEKIIEKEGKHFILYGPRFKMPLKSPRFPLVVDQTAMSNFVHQMLKQFENLARKKKDSKKETTHEESPSRCLPAGL